MSTVRLLPLVAPAAAGVAAGSGWTVVVGVLAALTILLLARAIIHHRDRRTGA